MATSKPGDPLLGAAKVLLILFTIAVIFGMVMLGIGTSVLLTFGRYEFMTRIAAVDAPAIAFWGLVGGLLLLEGMLYLGLRFIRELSGIVNSVGAGAPFHPRNAGRLSRMGWIMIIAEGVALPLAALLAWFAPYLEKAGKHVEIDFGLDAESILLILILFILARVFREGARMNDELEGTV